MERISISCDSCERIWTLGCTLSIYEQQTLEGRPCPHCGAYTLSVLQPVTMAAIDVPSWQDFASYV